MCGNHFGRWKGNRMRLDIAKFEKGDDIALLLSPGYGAGWSTWNYPELAYDKRVIEFWMEHRNENPNEIKGAKELFKSWGYEDIYWGGFRDIELTWIRKGRVFRIVEYDGSEHIEMFNDAGWLIAR